MRKNNPSGDMENFDNIRPYEDREVIPVVRRLLDDREFVRFIGRWRSPVFVRIFPGVVDWMVTRYLSGKLRGVSSIREFQEVVEQFVTRIIRETTTEFVYEGFEALDRGEACLFVSNHRDIAGDSMLLNYALYHSGLDTVRIAVGDNLIQRRFATDLMKLNKSFFIKRTGDSPKEVYAGLMQASKYIQHSLREGQSVWIAQSEGRSKDGIDRTDPAVVKMLALSERKKELETVIGNMNIRPVSLSYEFDPCDEMKARELEILEKTGCFEKAEGEDLLSLVRGLGGDKGKVVLRVGQRLDASFTTPEAVAAEIDRQIVGNLELFPINYWALSRIQEVPYTALWEKLSGQAPRGRPEEYEARLERCSPEYRLRWLKLYANPVLNRHGLIHQP